MTNPQTIYFGDESSGESGRIQYSHSSDSMIFKTNGNNERLRITSTGQLNIAGDMQFTAANPELEFNNGTGRFRIWEITHLPFIRVVVLVQQMMK